MASKQATAQTAAAPIAMNFYGERELLRLLQNLPDRVRRNVTRRAVRAGTRPIVNAARVKVPKESGLLRRSLGVSVKMLRNGNVRGRMAPRHQPKWSGEYQGRKREPFRYAHLVERGYVAADGSTVPAQPFMRPAVDEQEQAAFGAFRSTMREGIVKEAHKLAAKGGK